MPALRPVRRRQVALLIETSNAYARGLLQGVVHYIREHQPWSFHLMEQGRGDDPPAWLEGWKGDGIIARIETPRIAAAVMKTGLPAVDLSAARLVPALPWVETDDAEIARLAAEHLLERGFRNFAFCGEARFNWSVWREQHFAERVRAAGHECHFYRPKDEGAAGSAAAQVAEIGRWLQTLPKPVGIMACYDNRGQQVLDACRSAGFAVPDEVAVIGVDNDELLCELASPPLSSVMPNAHRTGYVAAARLDRLMAGKKVTPMAELIPPLGVASRHSTDAFALEDRAIVQAVRMIREHACEGINVGDVLKVVPLSRRVLEQRFQKQLGRTPREEILQVRLARVKQLLGETKLALYQIAERTGFEHVEYLSVVFKRETGLTPSVWRAEARG
ncbi:MAG: DNA-binding transcriptional regulator [Undibacterium sp.]|nr:DNA-binding transcriptional regulator [Opitutaceae bacterium]